MSGQITRGNGEAWIERRYGRDDITNDTLDRIIVAFGVKEY